MRPASHPVDYPIANLGEDTDVIATSQSLDSTEKKMNHTWILSDRDLKKKDEYPMNYKVANFGMDNDIKFS